MIPTYFLIAYKPDSSDYCMGCHMASYSSDFNSHNHLTREKLIEHLAVYEFKNFNLDTKEAGYEFIIMRDGFTLFDSINGSGATQDRRDRIYGTRNDDEPTYYEDLDAADAAESQDQQDIESIIAEAKAKAQVKRDEKVAAEARAKAEMQQKNEADAQERRRKEYDRLKAEFENENPSKEK